MHDLFSNAWNPDLFGISDFQANYRRAKSCDGGDTTRRSIPTCWDEPLNRSRLDHLAVQPSGLRQRCKSSNGVPQPLSAHIPDPSLSQFKSNLEEATPSVSLPNKGRGQDDFAQQVPHIKVEDQDDKQRSPVQDILRTPGSPDSVKSEDHIGWCWDTPEPGKLDGDDLATPLTPPSSEIDERPVVKPIPHSPLQQKGKSPIAKPRSFIGCKRSSGTKKKASSKDYRVREHSVSHSIELKTTDVIPAETISADITSRLYASGTTIFDEIFGHTVRVNFGSAHHDNTCAANNEAKTGGRCSRRLRKGNQVKAAAALERLSNLQLLADLDDCLKEISDLVELIFCGRSHRTSQLHKLGAWRSELGTPPKQKFDDTVPHSTHKVTELTKTQHSINVSRIETDHIRPKIAEEALFPFKASTQQMKASTTIRLKTTQRTSYIQRFLPYCPKVRDGLSTQEVLTRMVTRDLTPRELTRGFLYVYWFPGNFGMRKIGITKNSIEQRIEQWEKQCGHPAELIYPLQNEERKAVQNVYRLEALVHAELKDYRVEEKHCQGPKCRRSHKEWFRAGDDHVKAVVKKWTSWISKAPYERITIVENAMEETAVWRLKEKHRKTLEVVCRASDIPKAIPKSSSKQKGSSSASPSRQKDVGLRRSPRLERKRLVLSAKVGQPADSAIPSVTMELSKQFDCKTSTKAEGEVLGNEESVTEIVLTV
ncbi:hypothetical protein MMC24_005966 [Lignoscripta atroalba]|nr:hypothetical protein [Lignoscripta atroalba]